MPDIDALFRARIGWDAQRPCSSTRSTLLREVALSLPFENLKLFDGEPESAQRASAAGKIALRDEGGLCYELNPALSIPAPQRLEASLIRATVFDEDKQDWLPLVGTHVAILLWHQEQGYLLDCGFGLKQPMRMVPLCGETVVSANATGWRGRPAPASRNWNGGQRPGALADRLRLRSGRRDRRLRRVERDPAPHRRDPRSPFNKSRLMALLTAGDRVLTEETLTETRNGKQCQLALRRGVRGVPPPVRPPLRSHRAAA